MNIDTQNFFETFLLYLPLGIIGAWRWSIWLFQKIMATRYTPLLPKDTPSSKTLSIVTPVYNENPVLFQSALLSWAENKPTEIIAVIDASDTTCIKVFQDFQSTHQATKLVITETPGKRPALALGSRLAQGEIIALVDSDTVWDTNICESLLAPFEDESVGGVSCRQAVLSPRTAAEKLFNIRLSLRYLQEYPYLMAVGDALTCLSGRTAIYRKSALLPVLDQMLEERFLGKPCISGEDKRLTSLVMRAGWKVRFQQNAVVRTEGMPRLRDFFKQNLRWSRNSWRTDLRLIASAWVWKREPLFGYHLIDRCIQPFTLLLGPIYFCIFLYFANTTAAGILLVWILGSRFLKLTPHLREHPKDITTVPLFTLAQYHLAILKIYALLSLDFQSWITRWHASRLRRNFLELFPSQLATLAIIVGITSLAFSNAKRYAHATEAPPSAPYTNDFSLLKMNDEAEDFWRTREENKTANYLSRSGETPHSILRKFNIPEEKQTELFPKRLRDTPLPPGTSVKIPVAYLEHSLSPARKGVNYKPPIITYRPLENMIHVKGQGNVIRLRDIARALPYNQKLLTELKPKEWILRSKLYISEDVTLILDGTEVSSLKLQSSPQGYTYIRSQHGNILINQTKVTSWDEEKNNYDTELEDGRAFIVAYGSGRMDILDSEIAYLGFPLSVATRYQNFGGNYGLSWKIQNNTFNKNLMAGNVKNSLIHHNYFGIYTYGASGMLIQDNEIFENIQYGIDPHDDSNNLLIENNFVHHNGNHGIIGSKRVKYSTIRNNYSENNRLHGIMLDRDTDYNLVEDNYTTGNINGLALSASHKNLVRGNIFKDNRFGIRGSSASSRNIFTDNTIKDNEKGVYLYGNSKRNIIKDNTITDNTQGVYLKESRFNALINSLKPGKNIISIKLDEKSRNSNFIQKIQ